MGIKLSAKHGLNPTVDTCFFCGGDKNILLVGAHKTGLENPDGSMPMKIGVTDMSPCQSCEEYMKMGVILVSIRNEDVGNENPYRTGGWAVVKDAAIKKNCSPRRISRTYPKS